ncbi:MAG: arginine--tRNA ligase [Steroidobacteraceae bacterium]|nr:arginine--tRNA ligase [Steroidobacteraceae bacterium]
MKPTIDRLVRAALAALPPDTLPAAALESPPEIERTRDPSHGDYATNVALRHAKAARRNPRQLAEAIVKALPADPAVAKVEIAGPGFINFHLAPAAHHAELLRILDEGERYGRAAPNTRESVLLEFVSANPTGPLHVGHGRHAAYGGALGNLLEAVGHRVHREFYINDAGRQVDILAVSVWLRYLERLGETLAFPANGYRGDYVRPVAERLEAHAGRSLHRPVAAVYADVPPDEPAGGDKEAHVDALIARMRALLGDAGFATVIEQSLAGMLADIRDDLGQMGVTYDRWYSERSLTTDGAIDAALERLRANGHLYEKDGATWFRASAFGDDEDRVVVRANGAKTYFASDIAYHLDKRLRGFDRLIDVLGADHHGYVARVRGGLSAMGEPGDCLEVCLMQLVSLYRGGEKVAMGKREGNFVTLRQLRDEVGNDATRFFYVMRSHEQHLDFDLELAKSRSSENPVYYVQYAHARVASVLRQLADRGLSHDAARGRASLARLDAPHEKRLLTQLSRYPEVVEAAAHARAPHALVQYLRELATDFHGAYAAGNENPGFRFIVDDAEQRDARLALLLAARQVLRNGLGLLGVSAPETM